MRSLTKLAYLLVLVVLFKSGFSYGAPTSPNCQSTVNNQTFEDDFGNTELASAPTEDVIWDPLESINRQSFKATMWLDDKIIAPIDRYYLTVVPCPIRAGIVNAYLNLLEPSNIINNNLFIRSDSA